MEYLHMGDLETFLKSDEGESLSIKEKIWIAIHIARGLNHIQSQLKINHNDLAARNVLLTLNDRSNEGKYLAKISDFGLSNKIEDYHLSYQYGGSEVKIPVRWVAPEVFMRKKFSQWSDVWSYGVTVWEIMENGLVPYWEKSTNEEVKTFVAEGGRLKKPAGCPLPVWTVLEACWKEKPSERISMIDIVEQFVDWVNGGKNSEGKNPQLYYE
jgi:serine/threonine protein kinase